MWKDVIKTSIFKHTNTHWILHVVLAIDKKIAFLFTVSKNYCSKEI